MNIPQEIQDLMPERKTCVHGKVHGPSYVSGYNNAITEVEAVLPQIIALAEKRGAEGERERISRLIDEHDPSTNRDTNPKYWGNTLRAALTQPNHDQ